MPIARRGFSKSMKGIDTKAITVQNIVGTSNFTGGQIIADSIDAGDVTVDGTLTFSQLSGNVNFSNQQISNVNIVSGTQVNVTNGIFTNLTVNGNITLPIATSQIIINGNKVLGARQSASPIIPVITTVGTNNGTVGTGLTLLGNTASTDQSLAIMNDFRSLQKDIANLKTAVDGIRTVLLAQGIMG
jgi:hypothetical protein